MARFPASTRTVASARSSASARSAASARSTAKVTLLTDGFTGSVIDTERYAVSASGVTQNNAILFASGSGQWNQGIITKTSYARTQQLTMEFDLKCTSTGYLMLGFHEDNHTNFGYTAAPHYIYLPQGDVIKLVDENSVVSTSVVWAVDTQYRFRIVAKTGGGAEYYYSTDGGQVYNLLGTTSTVTTTPLRFGSSYYGGNFTLDNLEINGFLP